MVRILIIEDEKPISDLIKLSLTKAGYNCECAYDGLSALELIKNEQYDLLLVDIMLPYVNGYEILDYVRPLGIPMIFITAMASVDDKVKGLKNGAEDYISKPFEILELLARVEVVLRRYHKDDGLIDICGLIIDSESRIVKKDGKEIFFTKKEFEILLLFAQNPEVALYREQIYEKVWRTPFDYETRTVDLHIQRIRKKAGWEKCLTSMPKVGYRLEVNKYFGDGE